MKRRFLDIDELLKKKPGNEGDTHFVLKHVAKAWMWDVLKVRVIGTEIYGLWSTDYSSRTVDRRIVLSGVRLDRLKAGLCPFCKSKLIELNVDLRYWSVRNGLQCVECSRMFFHDDGVWWTHRKKMPSERLIIDVLGINKRKPGKENDDWRRTEMWTSRGIEVKTSLSDFRAGFCRGADFTYVMAPKGVIPPEEVPKGVGFIEVDMERLKVQIEPVITVHGARIVKKARFMMDSRFKSLDEHQKFMVELIARIAMRNTLENMKGGVICD